MTDSVAPLTTLERLALSRATVDRAAHRRAAADLLETLLATETTAVLVLDGDRTVVEGPAGGGGLVLLAPAQALALATSAGREGEPLLAFLGEQEGRDHLLLALPGRPPVGPVPTPTPPDGPDGAVPLPDGRQWAGLRELGAVLDDTGAGLLTCSVALANWHAGHPRCSRCGHPTDVIQSGWARQCPECGTEHYPRTDPAVIMAVVDADDRILLGRQARWPAKRFSTLAGFVEPGESLEAAVRREVLEEAGIVVGRVEYRGSQPWPFPSSLMLGFHAYADASEPVVDGEELAQAQWWTREQLAADVASAELLLPPPVSIARRLIEAWFGGPIEDGGGAWR